MGRHLGFYFTKNVLVFKDFWRNNPEFIEILEVIIELLVLIFEEEQFFLQKVHLFNIIFVKFLKFLVSERDFFVFFL